MPALPPNPVLNAIAETHFLTYRITENAGSRKGENNFGVIRRVAITGRSKRGRDARLELIIKSGTADPAACAVLPLREMFAREIYTYDTILPAFARLAADTATTDCLRNVPTLYRHQHQSLILEDMKGYGFELRDNTVPMDYAHCKLILEQLGRFHGFSYAMKERRPDEFRRLIEPLDEVIWKPGNGFAAALQGCVRRGVASLSSGGHAEARQRFGAYFGDVLERIMFAVDAENAGEFAVINHGDCWNNNALFRYSDAEPVDVCIIDYQLVRYCTPVFDIVYFLYMSTEKEMRDKHYDRLMDDYYNSVVGAIGDLGADAARLFPRQAFQQQLHKFSGVGLALALVCLLFFSTNNAEVPNVQEIVTSGDMCERWHQVAEKNDRHQRMIRELIVEMVERNYI